METTETWWWKENNRNLAVVEGNNRNVVVALAEGKINVVMVLYSFTIHEAVLKKNVESRVDVESMWSWMEKYICKNEKVEYE